MVSFAKPGDDTATDMQAAMRDMNRGTARYAVSWEAFFVYMRANPSFALSPFIDQ